MNTVPTWSHNVTRIQRMMVCQKQRIDQNEKYGLALSAVDQGRISVRLIATLLGLMTATPWSQAFLPRMPTAAGILPLHSTSPRIVATAPGRRWPSRRPGGRMALG